MVKIKKRKWLRSERRLPGHPEHEQWLEEQREYYNRYRREKAGLPEDAELPRGRPKKERCICPTCGGEHFMGQDSWDVKRARLMEERRIELEREAERVARQTRLRKKKRKVAA